MTIRKPLLLRPWVSGARYDTITRPNILHYDVIALRHFKALHFVCLYSQQGKHLRARSDYCLTADGLTECEPIDWLEVPRVTWTRGNHALFRVAHKALVALGRQPMEGWTVSPLFHYVSRPDLDPWPRTMANGWKYNKASASLSPFAALDGIL